MPEIRFMESGRQGRTISNEEVNAIINSYQQQYEETQRAKGGNMETKTYANATQAGDELDRRVNEMIFNDPKLTYKEAQRRILAADENLKRAYAQA